jgi:hypothetical protein
MTMSGLIIGGTIVDKEGKPIDNRHAHWMVHQFLSLMKWCGLEFIGHVTEDGVKGIDIYRTGVVEADPFDTQHPVEKPVKVRYRRQDDAPALSIVARSDYSQPPTQDESCDIKRRIRQGNTSLAKQYPLEAYAVAEERQQADHVRNRQAFAALGCPACQKATGVAKELPGYPSHAAGVKCSIGQTCYIDGHLTIVCMGCIEHKRLSLVNRAGYCKSCQDKGIGVVNDEAEEVDSTQNSRSIFTH